MSYIEYSKVKPSDEMVYRVEWIRELNYNQKVLYIIIQDQKRIAHFHYRNLMSLSIFSYRQTVKY